MPKQVYDIRTSEAAFSTLVNLTGVSKSIWEKYCIEESRTDNILEQLTYIIESHGHFPSDLDELEVVYIHVTTSANGCESIKNHGVQDLVTAYKNTDSELRLFLDEHDIHINLEKRILAHAGIEFDISLGDCPNKNTAEYWRRSVGRKFYSDYTTCGFFSVDIEYPYGGQVHLRPEVLENIGNLLHLDLSREWQLGHSPYEIVAKLKFKNVSYHVESCEDEFDPFIHYLAMAYCNAFESISERILITNSNVHIPPQDIMEITPITYWHCQ